MTHPLTPTQETRVRKPGSYVEMVKRLQAHPGYDAQYRMRLRQMVEHQPLPQGTPIRWYQRLWWRVRRLWT